MDLNDAFNIVIEKLKFECNASNGRCDKCKLHNVCYINSTGEDGFDENRFSDFPYEIVEMMKNAVNEGNE